MHLCMQTETMVMKQRYQVSCGIRTEARPGAHDQRIHLQIAALDANV